jgi:hypothetical protein
MNHREYSVIQEHEVAQLVETLLCKPEGRGFHSRWVIEIFHLFNPAGRTKALGPTQPVTEISITDIFRGKGGRCVGLTAWQPYHLYMPIV